MVLFHHMSNLSCYEILKRVFWATRRPTDLDN